MRASRTLSVPGNVVRVQDDSRAVVVALIGVPAGVGCRFSGRILGDGEEASALWSTMTFRHRRLSFFTGAWPDVSAGPAFESRPRRSGTGRTWPSRSGRLDAWTPGRRDAGARRRRRLRCRRGTAPIASGDSGPSPDLRSGTTHGIGRGVVDGDGRQATCRRARRHRSPSRPSPRRGAGSPGGRRGLVASRPARCRVRSRAPSPRRRRPLPGPAAVGQSFIGLRPWVMRNPRKMVNGTTLRVPVGLVRHDPAIPRPGTAPTMGRSVRSASFEGRRFTTSSQTARSAC